MGCRALVALGAKVNGKDCSGATPIAQAAFHGHLDVAACLLEANAGALPAAKALWGQGLGSQGLGVCKGVWVWGSGVEG